jgi:hypothetical protein
MSPVVYTLPGVAVPDLYAVRAGNQTLLFNGREVTDRLEEAVQWARQARQDGHKNARVVAYTFGERGGA